MEGEGRMVDGGLSILSTVASSMTHFFNGGRLNMRKGSVCDIFVIIIEV